MRPLLGLIFALSSSVAVAATASPSAARYVETAAPARCLTDPVARQASFAPQERVVRPPETGVVGLWVKGGHGRWCRGIGICFIEGTRDKGPHCRNACTPATLSHTRGDVVTLEFRMKRDPEQGDVFHVDKDLDLPPEVARQLGARGAMAVRKGKYRPSWSADGETLRVQLRVRGEWGQRTTA